MANIEDQITPLPIIPLSTTEDDESVSQMTHATSHSKKGGLTGLARLSKLAEPKAYATNFCPDRRSVYWTDGPLNVPTDFKLSERSEKLSNPKMSHKDHRGDRPSPIWKVKTAAKNANATCRVLKLAEHKTPHGDWEEDMPVVTSISESAMKAVPTGRIIQLARPKEVDPRYITPSISRTQLDILQSEGERKFGQDGKVTERPDQAPAFVDRLSNPKGNPKGFKTDRPVKWAIPEESKKAEISARVDELSKIRRVGKRGDIKSMHEDYSGEIIVFDPKTGNKISYNPYKVSNGAMNAKANERIDALSTPIARKMRQKK